MSNEIRKYINKVINLRGSDSKKYKGIGARNLMEGIRMNGFSIDKKNDPQAKTIYFDGDNQTLSEEISSEFEQKEKGGVIVFSVDVNAVKLSNNVLIKWVRNKIETLKNITLKSKKITTILNKHEIYGVTIGKFVTGRYRADDGSLYDEQSLSLELIGITSEVLNMVAEDIVKDFKQETVLVKNYVEDRIYLVK